LWGNGFLVISEIVNSTRNKLYEQTIIVWRTVVWSLRKNVVVQMIMDV